MSVIHFTNNDFSDNSNNNNNYYNNDDDDDDSNDNDGDSDDDENENTFIVTGANPDFFFTNDALGHALPQTTHCD